MSIFEFDSYVEYILMKIQVHAKKRGYQSELARAAKCQTSYFSSILQHKVFLTPDQASELCDFWGLTDTESEYFLALVNLARSGSASLKRRLKQRLARLREKGREVSAAILPLKGSSLSLSTEDQSFFHQNWLCAGVYGAIRIQICKTTQDLSHYLQVSVEVIAIVLKRMEGMGLVRKIDDAWVSIENTVLSNNFEDYSTFHASLQDRSRFKNLINQGNNLRYSFVGTCSLKEFEELKAITRQAMNSQIDILRSPATEETLVGVCYDVFEL